MASSGARRLSRAQASPRPRRTLWKSRSADPAGLPRSRRTRRLVGPRPIGARRARGIGDAIVICSPDGARSKWVNEEIRTFSALGRRDRIRCLVVAGEPHSGDPATECLPPALFEGSDTEPLAADLRKGEDGKAAARLKLIAGVIGVPYDELRQREVVRRQQRLAIIAVAATVGFLLMAGLAIVALIQRNIARERTATAEQTVAFVKSMFEVSDPSRRAVRPSRRARCWIAARAGSTGNWATSPRSRRSWG